MRSFNLDKVLPMDANIGELKTDENGQYRMVADKKVYQIEEKTQADIDRNLTINRWRMGYGR